MASHLPSLTSSTDLHRHTPNPCPDHFTSLQAQTLGGICTSSWHSSRLSASTCCCISSTYQHGLHGRLPIRPASIISHSNITDLLHITDSSHHNPTCCCYTTASLYPFLAGCSHQPPVCHVRLHQLPSLHASTACGWQPKGARAGFPSASRCGKGVGSRHLNGSDGVYLVTQDLAPMHVPVCVRAPAVRLQSLHHPLRPHMCTTCITWQRPAADRQSRTARRRAPNVVDRFPRPPCMAIVRWLGPWVQEPCNVYSWPPPPNPPSRLPLLPNYGTGMYLSACLTHCLHMLATLSMGIPTTPARTASCHGAACRT